MTSNKLTIHLTVAAAPGAPRVPLEIDDAITPSALFQQAVATTHIPASALKLIFRGRLIQPNDANSKAVTEYKLEDGSVLHCMGKPQKEAENSGTAATTSAAAAPALPSVHQTTNPPVPAAATTTASATVDPLTQALRVMRASNPPAVYQTAVETLHKLVSKIIEHPMEAKYRKIKKENPAVVRKLAGLPGGDAALQAAGFVVEPDDSENTTTPPVMVYHMHASAEAWPKLLAAQTTLQTAVQQAAVAAAPAPVMGGFQPAPPAPGAGQLAGTSTTGMPSMQAAATANLMANPQALQAMMQNPMVQNMLRNDPRFANNPMAQQFLQNVASNPAMLQQMTQMMQDPVVQQQIQQMQQNPAMMQQMQQQMQSMWGSGNAGAGAGGIIPPSATGGSTTTNNNSGGGASDQDMTEEEMIAEAIRRSLQDNNNNNN